MQNLTVQGKFTFYTYFYPINFKKSNFKQKFYQIELSSEKSSLIKPSIVRKDTIFVRKT